MLESKTSYAAKSLGSDAANLLPYKKSPYTFWRQLKLILCPHILELLSFLRIWNFFQPNNNWAKKMRLPRYHYSSCRQPVFFIAHTIANALKYTHNLKEKLQKTDLANLLMNNLNYLYSCAFLSFIFTDP